MKKLFSMCLLFMFSMLMMASQSPPMQREKVKTENVTQFQMSLQVTAAYVAVVFEDTKAESNQALQLNWQPEQISKIRAARSDCSPEQTNHYSNADNIIRPNRDRQLIQS